MAKHFLLRDVGDCAIFDFQRLIYVVQSLPSFNSTAFFVFEVIHKLYNLSFSYFTKYFGSTCKVLIQIMKLNAK